MKMIKKIFVVLTTVMSCFFLYAAPPCPGCTTPGQGGAGGTTPGAVSSPIDMYVYFLAIAAILMIAYFAKRYKTQQI